MQPLFLLFLGILFFLLSPTILVRLPMKGSKFVVAAVHATLFVAIVYLVTHFHVLEGVENALTFTEGCTIVGIKGPGPDGCGSSYETGTPRKCMNENNVCKMRPPQHSLPSPSYGSPQNFMPPNNSI